MLCFKLLIRLIRITPINIKMVKNIIENYNFKNFLKEILNIIQNINDSKLEFTNPQKVAYDLIRFRSITYRFNVYIKEFEDFDNFAYFLDELKTENLNYEINYFKNFLNNHNKLKEEFDKIFKEKLKELFGTSNELIEFNNALLNLGIKIQQHFIDNLDNLGFTDQTKSIQPYFEKHPEILSFFLSLGLPDKEKQEIYSNFLSLYNTNFISINIIEDELFNYLAYVYAINEIIKMVSYITPKMLLKE